MTNDIEDMNDEDFPEQDITVTPDDTETVKPCPCGKYTILECAGECGFNDLKPLAKAAPWSALPAANDELPVLPWNCLTSNPYVRSVCSEMLTDTGWKVIDKNSPRNSSIPLSERPKAVFIYDRSYVVATLNRVYSRLECDALQFIELACDACELPDDSAIRHAACDRGAYVFPLDSINFVEGELNAIKVLKALQDELVTFRALLPFPNEKGEYSVRYVKAVQLLEKLENLLKFDASAKLESIADEVMNEKVRRL